VSEKKFKVGDEVVIKGTVHRTDDSRVPYLVKLNDGDTCWFVEKNLESVVVPQVLGVGAYVTSKSRSSRGVAKIISDLDSDNEYRLRFVGEEVRFAEADDLTVVPAPSDTSAFELKFKVGDVIIHNGDEGRGPATIVEIDNSNIPYHFKFADGRFGWGCLQTCTLYVEPPKPEPKPEPKFKVGDKVLHLNKWKEWGVGTVTYMRHGTFNDAEYANSDGKESHLEEDDCFVYAVRYEARSWQSPERLLVKAKGV
jgi:hypothetical protein